MPRSLYDHVLAPAFYRGYRLYARRDEKARDYFAIRAKMFETLAEALGRIDPDRPRVLFHVASVGELLQAIPAIREVKKDPVRPVAALSYTSPSVARNLPRELPADLLTPSPFDLPGDVGRFLELLAPSLIVFSTYDLWPGFVWEAARRMIPMILINASLPETAGRLHPAARWFYRRLYPQLKAVGAITEADARRHQRLGVAPERARVTGNCRFDQTLARCRSVTDDDPDLAGLPRWRQTLVAGSTWPADHARLLPALAAILERRPETGAIIAPHEPSETHVRELEDFMKARGLGAIRYRSRAETVGPGAARVVVVDALGVLYKLYQRADVAYVGGGFKQGVHNVMEPAGMGPPVVFGPVHQNSAEALEMLAAGGAFVATDPAGLESILDSLLGDRRRREAAGRAARGVVEHNAGATARTMEMIREYLPGTAKLAT